MFGKNFFGEGLGNRIKRAATGAFRRFRPEKFLL
jgi:hypothetical protein